MEYATWRDEATADMNKLAYCLKKASQYIQGYDHLDGTMTLEQLIALVEDAQDILSEPVEA